MEAVKLGRVLIMATVSLALLLNVTYLRHSVVVGREPDYLSRREGAKLDSSESAIFEEMQENVKKMPYAHWRDVIRIQVQFQAIATRNLDPTYIEPSEYAKELVNALKIILAHRSSLKKAPLVELYQEHVIEPCKGWLPVTEKALSLFGELRKSSYLVEVPNKYVNNLFRTKICEYIIENDQFLQKHLRLDRNEIEKSDIITAANLLNPRLCTDHVRQSLRIRSLQSGSEADYAISFLTICSMSMEDEVEENLRMVSDEHKKDVEKLTEKLSSMSPYLIKEFLEDNFAHGDEKSSLSELYQKHVVLPCKDWHSAFEKAHLPHLMSFEPAQDYRSDYYYERGARLFRDNLEKGTICEHILKGNLGLFTEMLLNEKPKESGKGLFSRYFGRKKASP